MRSGFHSTLFSLDRKSQCGLMSRWLSFSVLSVIDSFPFWCTVHWEWGPLWKYVVWYLHSRFAGVVSAYLKTYDLTLRLPSYDVNCIWVIRSYRFEFQKSVGVFQIPAIIKWSQYYQCLLLSVGQEAGGPDAVPRDARTRHKVCWDWFSYSIS